jgi:hypothetical protein
MTKACYVKLQKQKEAISALQTLVSKRVPRLDLARWSASHLSPEPLQLQSRALMRPYMYGQHRTVTAASVPQYSLNQRHENWHLLRRLSKLLKFSQKKSSTAGTLSRSMKLSVALCHASL